MTLDNTHKIEIILLLYLIFKNLFMFLIYLIDEILSEETLPLDGDQRDSHRTTLQKSDVEKSSSQNQKGRPPWTL